MPVLVVLIMDFTAREGISDPAQEEKKIPTNVHNGIYGPFIVATTVSSAPKRGCCARCGGHVAMVTIGVKDGGWWLGCGVWANGRQSASEHCSQGKYGAGEQRCCIDLAKKEKKKALSKNGCLKHSTR